MKDEVPYLRKEFIESEAAQLLAEYGQEHGHVTAPPVPVDDIIELHLKLALEIKDLRQLFGFGDVHGAIWFKAQRIGIDQSLDPARHVAKRGRYHFTLAHEAGHWRLHRHLYLRRMDQPDLFDDGAAKPDYVCRSTEKKKPVEWQADQFAANLLMPRDLVRRAWEEWRGELEPIYLPDLRAQVGNGDSDDVVLGNAVRPFANVFQVSPEAMRIRLEGMELVLREKQNRLF
jgi:hypothetical protein